MHHSFCVCGDNKHQKINHLDINGKNKVLIRKNIQIFEENISKNIAKYTKSKPGI